MFFSYVSINSIWCLWKAVRRNIPRLPVGRGSYDPPTFYVSRPPNSCVHTTIRSTQHNHGDKKVLTSAPASIARYRDDKCMTIIGSEGGASHVGQSSQKIVIPNMGSRDARADPASWCSSPALVDPLTVPHSRRWGYPQMPMRLGRWSARAKKKFIIQEASDFGFPPRWGGERAMVWCWSSVVDVFLRTRALGKLE